MRKNLQSRRQEAGTKENYFVYYVVRIILSYSKDIKLHS